MRLKSILMVSSLLAFSGIIHAENVNLNEKPETTSVYLTPYAVGPGVGVLSAINQSLLNQSNAFLKLSIAQTWRFQEHWDAGLDLDWWVPGNNYGALLNVNYIFGTNGFRPFIGAGAGFQHVDNPGYANYGQGLGVEGQLMAGVYIDVTDDVHLRVRVPFQIVADNQKDRAAGLDIAMLFSLPQYNARVKKLNY